MSDRIDTELALSALHMAASTRALAPGWIHHTDRDCRYGRDDYLAALEQLEARASMSRKGDCCGVRVILRHPREGSAGTAAAAKQKKHQRAGGELSVRQIGATP